MLNKTLLETHGKFTVWEMNDGHGPSSYKVGNGQRFVAKTTDGGYKSLSSARRVAKQHEQQS